VTAEHYFFKTGKEECSAYYYRSIEELPDRLHYSFNHPKHEVIERLKNKYQTVLLKDACKEPIRRGEQPEYSEDGKIIVLKTVNLKESYIAYDDCLRVSEAFFEKHPNAQVEKGDVLVASTGYVSMGKVDVFDANVPAMVDGHISILRLREDYDAYFIGYFLRSHLGQIQFEKWFSGSSGQIEVQPEDLNQFILPQSSDGGINKDKQKEIASRIHALEEEKRLVERELDKLNRAIANLSLVRLGIDQSAVPRFSFKNSCSVVWFGQPENRFDFVWNHPSSVAIRDLLKTYGALPLSKLIDGDFEYGINASGREVGKFPFINVENLNLDGSIHIDDIRYVDEAPDSKIVRKGDLLISRSRTVGTVGYVSQQEDGFTFGSYILRFRIKTALADPLYVVNFINSSLGQAQITFLQSGSRNVEKGGGNNINPNELKQLMIILPKSQEDREMFCHEYMSMTAERQERKRELAEKVVSTTRFMETLLL